MATHFLWNLDKHVHFYTTMLYMYNVQSFCMYTLGSQLYKSNEQHKSFPLEIFAEKKNSGSELTNYSQKGSHKSTQKPLPPPQKKKEEPAFVLLYLDIQKEKLCHVELATLGMFVPYLHIK